MKTIIAFAVAVGSTQAFVPAPSANSCEGSALFAEGNFGFKAYVNGQDVNRADTYDTWFPADKPLYKPSGKSRTNTKLWVPFAKDPYGHAKVIQTDEELLEQVGAEMTIAAPDKPKAKSKGAKLMNGEGDLVKRYPRWIQSC